MEKGKKPSLPSFDAYYRCRACGQVVYDPGWRACGAMSTNSCCGSSGKHREWWPAKPVRSLLESAANLELTYRDEAETAVVALCAAIELLMGASLHELLKHRMDPDHLEALIPDLCVGEYIQIKLYNKLSNCSLENLLAPGGLKSFLRDWESLIQLRNKIVRGHARQQASHETALIVQVRGSCLKAFSLIASDVLRQVHKAPKKKAHDAGTALIVDDEEMVTKHLERFIERQGVKVLTATTGKGALELYESHKPRYVLLDVGLPDVDGLSVLKQIREMDPEANVFFITGIAGAAFDKEAQKLGARGHLAKPIDLSDVLDILEKSKQGSA